MNPLSFITYYDRHKRRIFLLAGLVLLATVVLYLMSALSTAIFLEPIRSNGMFLSKLSFVSTSIYDDSPGPRLAAQMRANPDIERLLPVIGIQIALPQLAGGEDHTFFLFGLLEEDIPFLLEQYGAHLVEGQIPLARTNGVLLSQKVAVNLGLDIGDTIHNSLDTQRFGNISAPLEVVGILDTDISLGILSYEYLSSHESYRNFPAGFLVAAREGQDNPVAEFLLDEVQSTQAYVMTYQELVRQMDEEYRAASRYLAPIILAVALAISFVVGVLNRLEFARRLPEFGLLHASGYNKRCLVRNAASESVIPAGLGWLAGVGISWLILYLLRLVVFAPSGFDLAVFSPFPILLTGPVPLIMIGITLLYFQRILSRLDPVAVIERGELSLEYRRSSLGQRARRDRSAQPLAASTYFQRHKGQALMFVGTISIMILAVVVVIFLFTAAQNAQEVGLGYLKSASRVYARPGTTLHPGVVTQIKLHPLVERVIPCGPPYFMISLAVPGGGSVNASPVAVYAEDMAYLVEYYGLQLKQGQLPRPYSNEMVISEIVAKNRGLQLGDTIGDAENPAYPGAPDLPVDFFIVGIFATQDKPEQENLLGFISLEFLESHSAYQIPAGLPVIVVPKPGQKMVLDDWLENTLAGEDMYVQTYHREIGRANERRRNQLLTITSLESGVALLAAVALAVVSYISASQRKVEYGVLHALGYQRSLILWQSLRETIFSILIAWLVSVVICLAGMIFLEVVLFAPIGLQVDLYDLTPWFFTLPIPLVILLVTSGAVARTFIGLDPVAIIERRTL